MLIKKRSYASGIVRVLFFCSLCIVFLTGTETDCKKLIGNFSLGNGIVTGIASVVTGCKQISKIRKGDIVVAHSTNSLWDCALKLSAGIIIEEGGSNSHAILLGKKLGIPVIVGVTGATEKIVDGSLITLDCIKRTVYEVASNNYIMIKPRDNFYSGGAPGVSVNSAYSRELLHHGWQLLYEGSENNYQDNSPSIIDVEKKIIKNNNDTHNRYHNGIEFTLERLQQDKSVIKSSINEVRRNIERSEAWYVSKMLACQIGKISEKVYHCRPLEFFKNKNRLEVEKVFDAELDKPETVEYIWKGFSDFVKQGVSVNNETLGSFLFDKLVDNMQIEEADKEILKKNPAKMNDFVRESGTIRDEYMKFNVRNLSIQYYLEKYYK